VCHKTLEESTFSHFQCISGFEAAILDFWKVIGQFWRRHFVPWTYLGKVTKFRPSIPNGLEMAIKKVVWGVNLPPPLCLGGLNSLILRPYICQQPSLVRDKIKFDTGIVLGRAKGGNSNHRYLSRLFNFCQSGLVRMLLQEEKGDMPRCSA
jgi:hypothetical protein